jgi:hypothetical protein
MSYHVNRIAPVLPRLGARSVGGLGAVAALKSVSLESSVANKTRLYGPTAGEFFRSCMTDKLTPLNAGLCVTGSDKELPTLKGDQLEFYRNCMAQRPSDIPVIAQHKACLAEARKLSPGEAAAPAPEPSSPAFAPAPVEAAPRSNKWLWIGGAAVATGLAFVLLKK